MIDQLNRLNRIRRIAIYLVVSAVLLSVGHLLVIQRHSQAEIDWYMISPDAKIYLSMVEGSESPLPFSRRILVPLIASKIPFSPEVSLRIVTYVSIFMFYLLSFLLLDVIVDLKQLFNP